MISLFGFDGPVEELPGRFHLIDGMAHCIPDEVGGRLRALADDYEIVWATGWEDRANDRLPDILGLPESFPFLTFDGSAPSAPHIGRSGPIDATPAIDPWPGWTTASMRAARTGRRCARRPPCWFPPTPTIGLTEAQVEALLSWARAGLHCLRRGTRW